TTGVGGTVDISRVVAIGDTLNVDRTLKRALADAFNKIRLGQIDKALEYFSSDAGPRMKPLLASPATVEALDQIISIDLVWATNNVMTYSIVHNATGERRVSYISFIRTRDGIWRLEAI